MALASLVRRDENRIRAVLVLFQQAAVGTARYQGGIGKTDKHAARSRRHPGQTNPDRLRHIAVEVSVAGHGHRQVGDGCLYVIAGRAGDDDDLGRSRREEAFQDSDNYRPAVKREKLLAAPHPPRLTGCEENR